MQSLEMYLLLYRLWHSTKFEPSLSNMTMTMTTVLLNINVAMNELL